MDVASGQSHVGVRGLALLLAVIGCSGCSRRPKNGAKRVIGKITLGGQPLTGAVVVFTPLEGGSAAMGRTDESGNYKLVWAGSGRNRIEGAQIGENAVTISTLQEGAPNAKPPRPEVPEKVPYKYRVSEPPKVTVKKGANVIDIALESGPVEPPPEPKGKKGKAK